MEIFILPHFFNFLNKILTVFFLKKSSSLPNGRGKSRCATGNGSFLFPSPSVRYVSFPFLSLFPLLFSPFSFSLPCLFPLFFYSCIFLSPRPCRLKSPYCLLRLSRVMSLSVISLRNVPLCPRARNISECMYNAC